MVKAPPSPPATLDALLEEHIRKMLTRDLTLSDQIKLMDLGVKLIIARAKIKPEEDSVGSFFIKGQK
jgi:hypothetical protein